mmetsp:Transcript_20764/g.51104  ORF Transcript_20764/g.51104 Transcript_20764/m.51104 type:complete len:110 (-) Transcript_20764:101-430(-)
MLAWRCASLLVVLLQASPVQSLLPVHGLPTLVARYASRRATELHMRQRAAEGVEGEYTVMDRGTMKKAKDCAQCGKQMTWRKKWEKNWHEVKFCSERCRKDSRRGGADD